MAAKKQPLRLQEGLSRENLAAAVSASLSNPGIEEFCESLLNQYDVCRNKDGSYLTDDENVEMIVGSIQQMGLKPGISSHLNYPNVVFQERSGTTLEKSILCAKILADLDYDVAVIVFPDSRHAGIGLRKHIQVNGAPLQVFTDGQKNYVFVDTASPCFFTVVPEKISRDETPVVIPVGEGIKEFREINTHWKIACDLKRAEAKKLIKTKVNSWDKSGTIRMLKNSMKGKIEYDKKRGVTKEDIDKGYCYDM
jgi:hypothetical protein